MLLNLGYHQRLQTYTQKTDTSKPLIRTILEIQGRDFFDLKLNFSHSIAEILELSVIALRQFTPHGS